MNRIVLVFSFWMTLLLSCANVLAQKSKSSSLHLIQDEINQQYPTWENLYKHLHSNPEISFQEKNTAARLAMELKNLGYEVTENFGGYGLVAVLKNGIGKTIMMRADMDALPLEEKTNLPYASQVTTKDDYGNTVNTMHACGHDVHMTVLIGTAQLLVKLKNQWKGTLILVCQPAEERGSGAKAMLNEGLFKKFPKPDYALALHCNATIPAGKVGYCEGYALANVDMVDITVYGLGGHGAYPHTTIDPIVLGTRIVTALQTIVSREIAPTDPAVVTVGAFHAGTKGNIIPDKALLQLTLRSYKEEVRNKILESIRLKCKYIALSAGVPEDKLPEIKVLNESIVSTFNHLELTKRMAEVSKMTIGAENVVKTEPVMGGEDFAFFGRTEDKIPICIYWLGTVAPEKVTAAAEGKESLPSLHSPFFAPVPEPSIKTGVKTMAANVLELLNSKDK